MATLAWSDREALDRLAPARLEVPSGSHIAIDYGEASPVLAVKLQEMFGCTTTPRIGDGRVALVVPEDPLAAQPTRRTKRAGGGG